MGNCCETRSTKDVNKTFIPAIHIKWRKDLNIFSCPENLYEDTLSEKKLID
jgi:hypothetical protein